MYQFLLDVLQKEKNMGKISQKMLYGAELQEMSYRLGYDVYIWAEDLVNRKIIVYQGNIGKVIQTLHMEDYGECGLVYVNLQHDNYFRCIDAKCSLDGDMVFLTEKQFNEFWTDMQPAIEIGIQNENPNCTPVGLLDLSFLDRKNKNSEPVVKDGKIVYEQKQNAEVDKTHRARQSAMDNPKLIFCYSAHPDSSIYHDKTCEDVRKIADQNFRASATPPDSREPCPKCKMSIYLRPACGNRPKQLPILRSIFLSEHLHAETLKKLIDKGFRFTATDRSELHVFCNEDNWIARRGENAWTLWHNNYVRTSETGRYITEGYHDQQFQNRQLYPLLRYIGQYTWEGHLEAEQAKKEKERMALQAAQNQQSVDISTAAETPCQEMPADNTLEKKGNIFIRVIRWIRRHFS